MTSSSEYLERMKEKRISNYSSTFSGYKTKGAHDGCEIKQEQGKEHCAKEHLILGGANSVPGDSFFGVISYRKGNNII